MSITFDITMRSSCTTCLAIASSALLLMASTSDALAQPSPFDAYEGKKQVEKAQVTESTTPQNTPPPASTQPAAPVIVGATSQGQVVVDVRTALSATFSGNETADGSTVNNSTFFARISPGVGYFIRDNLEVGGSAGIMWRRIARSEDDSSTSRDFLFEAKARYHHMLTPRFSLIPGLSLGGYVGRSDRTLPVIQNGAPGTVEENTSTFGGAATATFDFGYVVKEQVTLNAGVGLIGLIGTERVGSLDERFRVSTVNASLNLGVVYAF